MTTRMPCHACVPFDNAPCEYCGNSGWVRVGGMPADADDEVYIVNDHAHGLRVFGHEGDAEAYALAKFGPGNPVRSSKVLDHAEARGLIEPETPEQTKRNERGER